MIGALLFVAALVADPVAAPSAAPSATTPPTAVAEADLREFAAIAGRKVVGRPVGGPWPTADKVLLIARDDKGYPVIAASLGFPVRQALPRYSPAPVFARPRLLIARRLLRPAD